MKCKVGIWLDDLGIRAPCGQCMPCRINKGRKWSARIIMEWLYCPNQAYFLTFTVAPEHRNARHSLNKQEWFYFIRAAQEALGPFRYYGIGEYGDDSFREHYHLAIFPEHPAQVPALQARWKKGFVSRAPLNHARARYLANYTGKKLTKSQDDRLKPGQEPEFRHSNRNPPLGAAFCEEVIKRYQAGPGKRELERRGDVSRCFRIDGRIYPVGDWALKKIRQALDIPLTHAGRARANPNYEDYYPLEGAEWNPEEALIMEKKIDAKARQRKYRGESPKV